MFIILQVYQGVLVQCNDSQPLCLGTGVCTRLPPSLPQDCKIINFYEFSPYQTYNIHCRCVMQKLFWKFKCATKKLLLYLIAMLKNIENHWSSGQDKWLTRYIGCKVRLVQSGLYSITFFGFQSFHNIVVTHSFLLWPKLYKISKGLMVQTLEVKSRYNGIKEYCLPD